MSPCGLSDVFEGGFLKPPGERLFFLVQHENAVTAAIDDDAEREMTV